MARPPVSVIVPFAGTEEDARRLLEALAHLKRREGDELLVVDNSPDAAVTADGRGVEVVRADRLASSYHARNVGAARAANGWLLFLDSDTIPPPSLLDDYFSDPPPAGCGIVAGEVEGATGQAALTARHARSRRHLGVEANLLRHGPRPAGGTANLMMRRRTWEELGGFHEVRSGADLEFCWRAQEAGWGFVLNPDARVEHLNAETLALTLRKAVRYGAGQAWSNRIRPGSAPHPPVVRQVARALAGAVIWPLALRFERAAFKALDGLWAIAYAYGYYRVDNAPRPLPRLTARR
jgi:GT2 family glycosyltransferase